MPNRPVTVLVVDDHEDNRALLQLVLESRGMTYHGAVDGVEGLERAEALKPDLILLDVEMPRLDGFGMLAELKRRPALADIPVIVLTATSLDAAAIDRGLSLGADEYLAKPINPDELYVRARGVVRANRAERELQQLRQDLTSMLVHDLRAPLEGVGIALNLLLEGGLRPEDSRQLMGLARDQIRDLASMVEELMEIHRAESGRAIAAMPLLLAPLVAEVVQEFSLVAQDKGLALWAESLDAGLEVPGDRALLKRVLANLVGNALKFTRAGSVTLRAVPDGEAVRIEVRDTGPGIPVDERDRLFDKYFHIQRRKERPEHGFGLGLAFCKVAVEDHGGTLGVTSEEGVGSTFWIRLPLASGAAIAAERVADGIR